MKKDSKKKQNMNDTVKNSIVFSGLIGTAGLFIAKVLGLFYSIPLSSILSSDELMSYYGTAYQLYSYILNVFTAGIPFAISTIVAKYAVLEDYKALLKIRKLSRTFLAFMGILGMLILILLSGPIAGIAADGDGVEILTNALRILSIAILLVPVLSAYRGFWEGRKEMAEYAFSQSFEQIFRVGFLLTVAYLIVYVWNMDRVYALYAAVASTSVAAFAGIVQICVFDRRNLIPIQNSAKVQTLRSARNKALFREIVILSIPYFLTAVMGYSDSIYNSVLLPLGLRLHGYNSADLSVILSATNYVGIKLCSIPQVLSPGFTAALIPLITEAITNHDKSRASKSVTECIGIVLFIGSFLSGIIAIYAKDFYNVLFYTENIDLASDVVRWMAIEGFLGTIAPVVSSLMIALGLKKSSLKRLFINMVIKGVLIVPFIYLFGYVGAVISTVISYCYLIIFNLKEIDRKFNIYLKQLLVNALKIVICLLVSTAAAYVLKMIGIDGSEGSRMIAFGKLCINGIVCMLTYFAMAEVFKIPQSLFHKDILSVVKSKLHRG